MIGTYPYFSFPSIYTLNSLISLERSRVTAIQNNPNFALYGQGVVVGFVDTGIDYTHPAFINADNTTRLISIWDQTIQEGGTPPAGFSHGAAYSKAQINSALRSRDPLAIVPSVDENGHGTMLAGIAAGNADPANDFSGVASESELIVVKLKQAKPYNRQIFGVPEDVTCYQESDLLMGVNYVVRLARELQKPLVLCIGIGTSQGGHDSQGVSSGYLDFLVQIPHLAIAVAGGNEGNKRRHFSGSVSSGSDGTGFELTIGQNENDFAMEVWQNSPQRLAIEAISPTGEIIPRIPPTLNECRSFQLVFENSTLWINNMVLEEVSGDQMILIRFRNPQPGLWRFRLINLDQMDADFNVWLPAGNLISEETFLLNSTPDVTLTSPGNTWFTCVASAYNPGNDSIVLESSRGYTRTGMIKPDIAAPGYEITCPDLNGGYTSATGTGAAAAHTAGIVAMILEWAVVRGNYTTITGRDIQRILLRGADRIPEITYPNPSWGYGAIDVMGIFQSLR